MRIPVVAETAIRARSAALIMSIDAEGQTAMVDFGSGPRWYPFDEIELLPKELSTFAMQQAYTLLRTMGEGERARVLSALEDALLMGSL